MDVNKMQVVQRQAARVMEALRKNRMQAYYVDRTDDVPAQVAALLREGDRVAVGGSMTLFETGVINLLRTGSYHFLDRTLPGLTAEGVRRIQLESFGADVYLTSVNAITEAGELYFVDGNGNRAAAVLFGPERVILVAGANKIVSDLDAAVRRVKNTAAPANALRLDCDTHCRHTGRCAALEHKAGAGMTDGCGSADRICCDYVVLGRQRSPGRITVVLVGEAIGY